MITSARVSEILVGRGFRVYPVAGRIHASREGPSPEVKLVTTPSLCLSDWSCYLRAGNMSAKVSFGDEATLSRHLDHCLMAVERRG